MTSEDEFILLTWARDRKNNLHNKAQVRAKQKEVAKNKWADFTGYFTVGLNALTACGVLIGIAADSLVLFSSSLLSLCVLLAILRLTTDSGKLNYQTLWIVNIVVIVLNTAIIVWGGPL